MRKPKIVAIGGYKFGIARMDAFSALEVFGDLQKELLPALGGLMKPESDCCYSDDYYRPAAADLVLLG